jgi:hypothetical protein
MSIQNFTPGGTIYNINGERGTLTCFARIPGQQMLYGVTAHHVISDGGSCFLGNPLSVQGGMYVGGPAQRVPGGLDASYFPIEDSVRPQLTQNNFYPVGATSEPLQVWNPARFRGKIQNAASAVVEGQLQQKQMAVEFVGSTQISKGNAFTAGQIGKFSQEITGTRIEPGDSGGCALDSGRTRYVALISWGDTQTTSNSGHVVLIQDAFASAGLVLATWADRSLWL